MARFEREAKLLASLQHPVDIRLEPTFQAGTPKVLFEPRMRVTVGMEWDVTADGERFLVSRPLEVPGVEPLTLIQNRPATLKK